MRFEEEEHENIFGTKHNEVDGNNHLNNIHFIIFQREASTRLLKKFENEIKKIFSIESSTLEKLKLFQSDCKFIQQCFYPNNVHVKSKIKITNSTTITFQHKIVKKKKFFF